MSLLASPAFRKTVQIGVTGAILVFAAVADEFRRRLIGRKTL